MLRHILLLKPNDKAEAIEKLESMLDTMKDLPERVPFIIHAEAQKDISGRSKGYEYLVIQDFESKEVLDEWVQHPVHAEIRDTFRNYAESIIFDFEM